MNEEKGQPAEDDQPVAANESQPRANSGLLVSAVAELF